MRRNRRGRKSIQTIPNLDDQGGERDGCLESMGELLSVPADPVGQWTVFIVMIEGGQVAPLRVLAGPLHHAGLKVDLEPEPLKQKQAGPRRWRFPAKARSHSRGRKKKTQKTRGHQHAVGLVGGKVLRRADEGKENHQTNCDHAARPHVQHQEQRRPQAQARRTPAGRGRRSQTTGDLGPA